MVFTLLITSVILLVTEWVQMEIVALLVLGATAVTGLVTPAEAIAGWSNPAVITVWAVFILSSGLTHTGVANIIGRQVMRLSGEGEVRLLIVIMATAATVLRDQTLRSVSDVAEQLRPLFRGWGGRIGKQQALQIDMILDQDSNTQAQIQREA